MHPEYGFDAVYFDETTDGSPESLPAMGEGCAFDCVAGACACESGTDGLGFLKLADVPFRLAAPAGHGLASRETVSLADLSGECVLMAGAGRIPQVDMVREELVRRVPDIEIVDSPACFYDGRALDMVTQLNALLLTLDMWDGLHPSFVTLPVRWSHAIPYGILYRAVPARACATSSSQSRRPRWRGHDVRDGVSFLGGASLPGCRTGPNRAGQGRAGQKRRPCGN